MKFRARPAAAGMRSAELASLKQSSSAPAQRRVALIRTFRSLVWKYWKGNGRHDLAWRRTKDPYRILVSEVMLQQTQVLRVIEKYKEFLKAFPNVRTLAKAPLANILRVWNGMGYNRRAKFLRDAAAQIVEKYDGQIPSDYPARRTLPGIGDYTARAVRVFAFNEPDILIETNIRAAFIHHFFISPNSTNRTNWGILDTGIHEVTVETGKGQDPREWHWALMDYGAYLKRSGVRNNHCSAHYVRQSKFEGSLRQARGAILRELQEGLANPMRRHLIGFGRERLKRALAGLARDGLIVKQKGKWRIA